MSLIKIKFAFAELQKMMTPQGTREEVKERGGKVVKAATLACLGGLAFWGLITLVIGLFGGDWQAYLRESALVGVMGVGLPLFFFAASKFITNKSEG
jgi:hypothetical protein